MTGTEKTSNSALRRDAVRDVLQAYRGYFDESTGADVDTRKSNYQALAISFYDLVTDLIPLRVGRFVSFRAAPQGGESH